MSKEKSLATGVAGAVDGALAIKEIEAQVNLINTVMGRLMKEGMHYGKIPGCGIKPTLLKPGAEMLSKSFRLRPIISPSDIITTFLENGHKEVTVYCHVYNYVGVELATGIGSATTMESKYRFRGGEKKGTGKPVPKEFWNLKDAGKIKEARALIGGEGFDAGKINGVWEICESGAKMENPNIADEYNTVLKIAKKRAYIDGILSATGASDVFTQDLEDKTDPATGATKTQTGGKPEVSQPQQKKGDTPKTEPAPAQTEPLTVTEALAVEPGQSIAEIRGELTESAEREKQGKNKDKSIADYVITDGEQEIKVSLWGNVIANIAAGDNLVFTKIGVSEFRGQKQFTAQTVEKEIPFGA